MFEMKSDPRQILKSYLPESVVDEVYKSVLDHKVSLHFTRARNSKLGDFRPAHAGKPHRISLNHNLNPYEMLITWVHELAHLITFEKHGRQHQPHGIEWKQNFARLMVSFLHRSIFPDEIEEAIKYHVLISKAANGSDLHLKRLLKAYDKPLDEHKTTIETLTEGSYFKVHDGRIFQKGQLLRKRFKCLCMNDKRFYLFSQLAVVEPIGNENPILSLYLTKKSS